jgi:hypothetical protein
MTKNNGPGCCTCGGSPCTLAYSLVGTFPCGTNTTGGSVTVNIYNSASVLVDTFTFTGGGSRTVPTLLPAGLYTATVTIGASNCSSGIAPAGSPPACDYFSPNANNYSFTITCPGTNTATFYSPAMTSFSALLEDSGPTFTFLFGPRTYTAALTLSYGGTSGYVATYFSGFSYSVAGPPPTMLVPSNGASLTVSGTIVYTFADASPSQTKTFSVSLCGGLGGNVYGI